MDKQSIKNIEEQQVIYNNGQLELKVSVNSDTIWLSQKQLCDIFEKDQSVISRHINNIFKDKEVDEKSNMQKMHIAYSDKPVIFYSLDIVLAVGYRTNSSKAIKFRQWASSVLKQYIQNAYVINGEKITTERFISLENEVTTLKSKIGDIKTLIQKNKLEEKLNSQYPKIELKKFNSSHDRFLIIDEKDIYHIGASLKDLGKKWFAFSKLELDAKDILSKLKNN